MNALVAARQSSLDAEDQEEELAVTKAETALPFVLKKLRPKHKEALSLVAQGYGNVVVAKLVDYTPEYVSALLRQPLCIEYIRTMNEVVAQQLEAQFGKAASVIAEAMDKGNTGEKLKAVRLHLEVTKRIGSGREMPITGQSSEERLASLSHRLIDLLQGGHNAVQQANPSLQGEASVRIGLRGPSEGREAPLEQDSESGEKPGVRQQRASEGY